MNGKTERNLLVIRGEIIKWIVNLLLAVNAFAVGLEYNSFVLPKCQDSLDLYLFFLVIFGIVFHLLSFFFAIRVGWLWINYGGSINEQNQIGTTEIERKKMKTSLYGAFYFFILAITIIAFFIIANFSSLSPGVKIRFFC